MKNQLIDAIHSGFNGEWTHIDPKKALAGLTIDNAKKKPNKSTHSCWELLHHIVIWQETIIKNIKGETIDWNEIEGKDNWPTHETMLEDFNFGNLLNRFHTGMEEAQSLLKSVDFINKSVGFPELSTIKLYLTLLQHTSYYIGQIITVRQILDDWPPKNDDGS